ncbi:stage II sporulation protein D [Bacillus mojavensis]|uniref:stage II sporulation protein D n=1 Tax=Bacillus mojavensis TaxID=72360 RepID=UPI002DB62120|nr:stage II sporulation protein D [Bacillus mojavensis]MEC1635925.1 stage II sporulation protein D [Bacillus mojavensis]
MKQFAITLSILCALILLVPTLLVIPFQHNKEAGVRGEAGKTAVTTIQESKGAETLKASPVSIPVYRTANQSVEDIPLEEYVIGVVASEMPATFEPEALKAQALAARTFIVRLMVSNSAVEAPKGSLVDDTQMFQVYKSKPELKKQWGADYEAKLKRITDAVASTQGKILTYNNQPIEASFFSTSNGYTENAESYWTSAIPYLKSVKSSWDKKSPKYKATRTFTVAQFEQKLGVQLNGSNTVGEITGETPGHQVATAVINGKKLKGRDIREKLGLNSADFEWKRNGDTITITTKGFGHGVGMSQYGANFMAKEGKTVDEIVKYYYQGTQISTADSFLNKYMAKK